MIARVTEIHFDFGVEAATVKADQRNRNIFVAFLTSQKITTKFLNKIQITKTKNHDQNKQKQETMKIKTLIKSFAYVTK